MIAKPIRKLLEQLSIPFQQESFYIQAMTHPSYVNEVPDSFGNNQRLEFMGDAVVQLIVTKFIYHDYETMDEGEMSFLRSNLVRTETLANLAREINLGDYILLGVGEEKAHGRNRSSLLCDVFEAFVGAMYLDLGFIETRKAVQNLYDSHFKRYGMDAFLVLKDYKTKLQELVQADKRKTLDYVMTKMEGSANRPIFEIVVKLDELILGKGQGTSKKQAEQEAAKDALSKMAQ